MKTIQRDPRRICTFCEFGRRAILFTGALAWIASATAATVWQIGVDDDPFVAGYNPVAEFSEPNYVNDAAPGRVTRLPGDPLYQAGNNPVSDDDFYLAGTYPPGFNRLPTALVVPNQEPNVAFKRAVIDGDNTNRIHFFLNSLQAGATSRLRLDCELAWSGGWLHAPINELVEGLSPHDLVVRFRNAAGATTILWSNRVDRDQRLTVDFTAARVQASAGPNTVELVRVGPTASNTSFWVQFDYVRLDADPRALEDGDGDSLPRWWEVDHGLSDADRLDALSDRDRDGLSAGQEYNGGNNSSDPNRFDTDGDGLSDAAELAAGTNPTAADSDGDSVADAAEVVGPPISNPRLADSDGDGFPDSLERRLGTDPRDAASRPTPLRGLIGIHFVAEVDPSSAVGPNRAAGVIPQTFWNETLALRWGRSAGSKAEVRSPLSGQLVRGDGTAVPGLTLNWTAEGTDASGNGGAPDRQLMSSYLRAYGTNPVSLNIAGVPFTNWDLHVVVGGSYDGQKGRIHLGANPSSDRFFRTTTTAPQERWVLTRAGQTNFPAANLVQYTNLTSTSITLTVTNDDGWSLGICAVQIVDRTGDFDSSGIPDWWELQHALQPGTPALAAADSDGDGISNLQEFIRGSNPRLADTDGDGLNDGNETSANALTADSDGDGLSDWAEVNRPIPTDPNRADTDGDGVSDKEEARLGTDPTYDPAVSPTFTGYIPLFRRSPSRWEWNLENVQLVWDHSAGALAPNIWNEDQLLTFAVRDPAAPEWRTFGMELRHYNGALTHLIHSDPGGGFSAPGQPGVAIWDTDYSAAPVDLKSRLGFSGYGPADISDRLQFRLFAQRAGSSSSWTVTFEIRNQTSNTVVVSRSFPNCTARNALDSGTTRWTDYSGVTNQPSMVAHQGVQLFISPTDLANRPAFTAAKDSDKDGMPDVWEDARSFNRLSAADAVADPDQDGLNNRDEFLAGTEPRLADTDGDGISDLVERNAGSDPLSRSSRPEFAGQSWPSGEDLDGNGLPDAWEVAFRTFGLFSDGDADGDGATNAQEGRAGTNPWDAQSRMTVSIDRKPKSDDVTVSWPHQPAKTQRLLASPYLTNWTAYNVGTSVSSGIARVTFTNHIDDRKAEYFVVSTDDRDADGDGLSDWAEGVLGSDPLRAASARAPMPIVNAAGAVTGTVPGDYAAFVEKMRGGPGGAGSGKATRLQAARLLQQATFGPTSRELDRVQALGLAAWIDDQISNQPPTLHRPYIERILSDFSGPRTDLTYSFNEQDQYVYGNNCTTPFARAAIGGPDQLRQRVAFALSQILVASRRDPNLEQKPLAMSDFYDIFVRHAFGSYRDVLREVSFHPVMGRYLSHVGNQKARPEINQYPDENFAREVMQLFSIGLWELNLDGTRRLDAFGQPIPTYGNAAITEFARVFTGLWFGGQRWGEGGWTDDDNAVPMRMFAEKHDFGAKALLRGYFIPARAPSAENAVHDVDDALRHLFEHPNTGPFIGRQLIQFLVTSNPSSNYVARVATVFAADASGRRGNLGAVVRAILSDEEARDARWFAGAREFGRLKEPVQRAMAIARAGRLDRYTNLLWWTWGEFNAAALQEPGMSPSVFNFFRPGYQPPGLLTQFGLVGPAFQIVDSYSSISFPNKLWELTEAGLRLWEQYHFPPDYVDLLNYAGDPGALADEVNLLFCSGSMSAATRDHLVNAVHQLADYDRLMRVRLAVYLAATCPEGAVQR